MKIINKYTVLFFMIVSSMQICSMGSQERQVSSLQAVEGNQAVSNAQGVAEERQARCQRNKNLTDLVMNQPWCADRVVEMLGGYAQPSTLVFRGIPTFIPWIIVKERSNIVRSVQTNNYNQLNESCLLLDTYRSLFRCNILKSHDFIKNYKEPKKSEYLNDFKRCRTLLHIAQDKKVAKFLLNCGVHIDEQDAQDYTALHSSVLEFNQMKIKLLLNYGANLEIADTCGNTPLFVAICYGDIKVITLLLSAGANIDAINSAGESIECFMEHNVQCPAIKKKIKSMIAQAKNNRNNT